jgi:hypothetical protein
MSSLMSMERVFVSLDGQVVAKETFRYLGLMLRKVVTLNKMLDIGFQLVG